MTPLFFGEEDGQLFGIHHSPQRLPVRDLAVVLCGAMGNEQVNAARAFRVLGARLARVGFHVLRFDYFGTGDSAGMGDEVDLQRWQANIELALTTIRARSALLRTALVGLRLGGALAALAAAERHDVDALVLWDPVATGAGYLAEINARQQAWVAQEQWARPNTAARFDKDEVLGFPLPAALVRDLNELDIAVLDAPTTRVLVVHEQAPAAAAGEGFQRHWRDGGARIDTRQLDAEPVWSHKAAVTKAMVPTALIEHVAKWLSGVQL